MASGSTTTNSFTTTYLAFTPLDVKRSSKIRGVQELGVEGLLEEDCYLAGISLGDLKTSLGEHITSTGSLRTARTYARLVRE